MNIEVLGIRFTNGSRTTKAFVDIKIGDIVIRDFRVCQNNGKIYIQNPYNCYKDADGKIKYHRIVDLPPNLLAEVNGTVLVEYLRRLREKKNEQQQR